MIKTPLRYPGGKSRAVTIIAEYLPANFHEYREPFIGGGSMFIYVKQKYPNLKYWINDLNPELFLFWQIAQTHLDELVTEIKKIKTTYQDGKMLFTELTQIDVNQLSELKRAVRFFVLNRITFSGTVESGGFSLQAFAHRFTDSSIERLIVLNEILADVKITNLDYREVVETTGKNVVIFLDPPYYSATKSRLYGKKGNLHTNFDHERFAEVMRNCDHNLLITYDNCQEIMNNFHGFNIHEWKLQYGMNNYQQTSAKKGDELMIFNYEINPQEETYKQMSLSLF
jgi:DNA adenine methylase